MGRGDEAGGHDAAAPRQVDGTELKILPVQMARLPPYIGVYPVLLGFPPRQAQCPDELLPDLLQDAPLVPIVVGHAWIFENYRRLSSCGLPELARVRLFSPTEDEADRMGRVLLMLPLRTSSRTRSMYLLIRVSLSVLFGSSLAALLVSSSFFHLNPLGYCILSRPTK